MTKFKFDHNLFSVLLFSFLVSLLPKTLQASINIDCNAGFVSPHATELIIDVFPTGIDDTENIQCALDVAALNGVPVVRLSKGDFFISNILIQNFNGSFQGTTRADTSLRVLDGSIDCDAFVNQSRTTSAMIFIGGIPSIKFMTITSNHPCVQEANIRSIVHFTGASRADLSCKNDVIFAAVDRVDFIGPIRSSALVQAAVDVSAEGWHSSSSCKNTLLGTFKFNQSSITGYDLGILSSMRAGAQVDINFNTFTNNRRSIWLVDSNQSTTITGNTFTSVNDDVNLSDIGAINIGSITNSPPAKTRVVVHNNQFTFTDVAEVDNNHFRGATIITGFPGGPQNISLSISDNRFEISGHNLFILDFADINNWVVTGNRFSGSVATGVVAWAAKASSVSGCLIAANTFSTLISKNDDVFLDPTSTNCIVGAGQGAQVVDMGVNNSVL